MGVAICSVKTRQMTRREEEGTILHLFRSKNWGWYELVFSVGENIIIYI